MARTFNTATAAGTFEYFHKGHEEFLLAAFDTADTIYIAITSDDFAKASRQVLDITPFAIRKKAVVTFLEKEGLEKRAKFIELHDIYGPTLEPDCPIEAIVVTEKTKYGADLINKLRKQKGLNELGVVEVAIIRAEDGGDLSSSRIRDGEIDRQRNLYIRKEWLQKTLMLPDSIRPKLQRPIGELIEGSEEDLSEAVGVIKKRIQLKSPRGWPHGLPQGGGSTLTVTVGDVVAQSFNAEGLFMDIAIVDFQIKRVVTFKNLSEIGFKKEEPDAVAKNPKGTLTGDTFKVVQKAIRHLGDITPRMVAKASDLRLLRGGRSPFVIRIIGEEDLATLAVILAAPLGTHVFYGQPDEGIVEVIVTEEKKSEVRDIVSQFS